MFKTSTARGEVEEDKCYPLKPEVEEDGGHGDADGPETEMGLPKPIEKRNHVPWSFGWRPNTAPKGQSRTNTSTTNLDHTQHSTHEEVTEVAIGKIEPPVLFRDAATSCYWSLHTKTHRKKVLMNMSPHMGTISQRKKPTQTVTEKHTDNKKSQIHEKSNRQSLEAWPYKRECRGHKPAKQSLLELVCLRCLQGLHLHAVK